MTDEQRVARHPREPLASGAAGADRWADYLDWVREDLIRGVLELPPDARGRPRVPSGWSPVELLSHVLHMEQRWFLWGFLGEQVAEPWGDWDRPPTAPTTPTTTTTTAADPADRPEPRWAVGEHTSAEGLAERLRSVGARTREVLARHPLHATASVGGRFTTDPPTLEWICFHVLAEYARHAGHLDVVVELTSAAEPHDDAPGSLGT